MTARPTPDLTNYPDRRAGDPPITLVSSVITQVNAELDAMEEAAVLAATPKPVATGSPNLFLADKEEEEAKKRAAADTALDEDFKEEAADPFPDDADSEPTDTDDEDFKEYGDDFNDQPVGEHSRTAPAGQAKAPAKGKRRR